MPFWKLHIDILPKLRIIQRWPSDKANHTCENTYVIHYRGVPRIFERGFLLAVDLRRGDLGAQPPDADECIVFRI